MKLKANGFAIIEILILVVVLCVLMGMGWYIHNHNESGILQNHSESTSQASLTGVIVKTPISPNSQFATSNEAVVSGHTLQAIDTQGKIVASTKTDRQGRYMLRLAPGKYKLQLVPAISPSGTVVGTVTIKPGENTYNISVDTGIR